MSAYSQYLDDLDKLCSPVGETLPDGARLTKLIHMGHQLLKAQEAFRKSFEPELPQKGAPPPQVTCWRWRYRATKGRVAHDIVGGWSEWMFGRAPSLSEGLEVEEQALFATVVRSCEEPAVVHKGRAAAIAQAEDHERERCARVVEAEARNYLPGGPTDIKGILRSLANTIRLGR